MTAYNNKISCFKCNNQAPFLGYSICLQKQRLKKKEDCNETYEYFFKNLE